MASNIDPGREEGIGSTKMKNMGVQVVLQKVVGLMFTQRISKNGNDESFNFDMCIIFIQSFFSLYPVDPLSFLISLTLIPNLSML